jgi:hypothetical protein
MSTKLETNTKLELETFAGRSIQAYKDVAREAGLVLRAPSDVADSGDFPEKIYSQLRRFRTVISKGKGEPKKIITDMHRQLVNTRDDLGKPKKTEFLTWNGYYEIKDFRHRPYNANIEAGRYQKPKVIANPNRTFTRDGEPVGPEFILSGSETVYTIEVPKSKSERKKIIDSIIGDTQPDDIKYYFKSYDELARRDSTFSYFEFCDLNIDELRKLSFQGGGSLTPGIWRDTRDGKLRDKFGQVVSPESGNKQAYQ